MTDTPSHETAHVFRIDGCGDEPRYIAADRMVIDVSGAVRLLNDDGAGPAGMVTLVARILPHPGQSVIRVDSLITTEGLSQP